MARKKAKANRYRPVDGILDELTIAVPSSWMTSLRVRADALGIKVEFLVTQLCGHVVDEFEQLKKAVDGPRAGDDPSRVVLRDSMLRSFSREALRTGLSIRVLLHRAVADAADAFDGREKPAAPKPLILIPGRRLGRGSSS